MKKLAGIDGRRARAARRLRDERKSALRDRPDFGLYLGTAEEVRDYGAEVDRTIVTALVGGTAGFCEIHGAALEETSPADQENGPSPDDAENRLVCRECETEELVAAYESVCLSHRLPLGGCLPCFVGGEPIEMEV